MQAAVRVLILVGCAGCVGEITNGFAGSAADAPPTVTPDAPPLTADGSVVVVPDAPPGMPGPPLGDFKLTYYYVTEESNWVGDGGIDDTALYDLQCNLLAMVPAGFARSLAIEGTGQLTDGRVLNYSGACSCATSPCYHFVDEDHPWGSGAGDRPLVPFRSVAVDRAVLTIGQWYWVAELDGILMPGTPPVGGFVHDGCVSADDTGGGVDGQHIDFFSALRRYYLALDGELGLDTVTLYEGGGRCP